MGVCSVSDVRGHFSAKSLTDDEYQTIIDHNSSVKASIIGCSSQDTSNPDFVNCVLYASVADAYRKARSKGELSAQVNYGNRKQVNTIDPDIQKNEDESDFFLKRARFNISTNKVLVGRSGCGTVDATATWPGSTNDGSSSTGNKESKIYPTS
jgi:hypothetical protein